MSIDSPKFEIQSEMEKSKEETFQRYLTGLDLDIEQLKDKRILDLGCGEEGEFVKKLLDDGTTKEIYGLDSAINPDDLEEKHKEHLLAGNFEEEFPLKDLDYIVSVGAIEPALEEQETRDPKQTILSAIESLKDNGEIRIFPIRNAASDSGLEGIIESREKWLEVLEDLSSRGLIDYELIPTQTKTSGNKPDTWTEEVLIIRKREQGQKFEKTETREVMKLPEIEIKSEKGLFLLSVLLKGYKPEWGNQKHPLVEETKEYFEKNPLGAESIEYLNSIRALEQDGIDEESLFVLSATYNHPEREPEDIERYKDIDKDKAEELKNGLFEIFEKLNKKLASSELAKHFERATEEDVEIRQGKMPETRKLLQGVIDFLRPSPETTKVKKVVFNPTNFLWRQESGRGTNFGNEFVISESAEIQDSNPHEFMHSIINPITEKLRERLTEEQEQKIIKMSPEMLKGKMDYGEHWYSLLNESLIRTYVDYFSKGENPGFESFRKKIDQIEDEADFQKRAENWDTRTKEVTEKLGIRTLVDLKEKLQQYFDMEVKSELAERVYDFYQQYAEAQKSDPNLNFEDYLQQNYEELVK